MHINLLCACWHSEAVKGSSSHLTDGHVSPLPMSGANWRALFLLGGSGSPLPKMASLFTGSAHTPSLGSNTLKALITIYTTLDIVESYKLVLPSTLHVRLLNMPMTFCSNNSLPMTSSSLSMDSCSELLGLMLTRIYETFRACSRPENYLVRANDSKIESENCNVQKVMLVGASNLRHSLPHFAGSDLNLINLTKRYQDGLQPARTLKVLWRKSEPKHQKQQLLFSICLGTARSGMSNLLMEPYHCPLKAMESSISEAEWLSLPLRYPNEQLIQ